MGIMPKSWRVSGSVVALTAILLAVFAGMTAIFFKDELLFDVTESASSKPAEVPLVGNLLDSIGVSDNVAFVYSRNRRVSDPPGYTLVVSGRANEGLSSRLVAKYPMSIEQGFGPKELGLSDSQRNSKNIISSFQSPDDEAVLGYIPGLGYVNLHIRKSDQRFTMQLIQ